MPQDQSPGTSQCCTPTLSLGQAAPAPVLFSTEGLQVLLPPATATPTPPPACQSPALVALQPHGVHACLIRVGLLRAHPPLCPAQPDTGPCFLQCEEKAPKVPTCSALLPPGSCSPPAEPVEGDLCAGGLQSQTLSPTEPLQNPEAAISPFSSVGRNTSLPTSEL